MRKIQIEFVLRDEHGMNNEQLRRFEERTKAVVADAVGSIFFPQVVVHTWDVMLVDSDA